MKQYDVVIIGAGVTGSLIARELSRYQLKVLLIEKESDVGSATSAANSALVHAGYDPPVGSLKAALNVQGNKLWEELAQQLDVDFRRTGDYVVAIGPEELPDLQQLYNRGVHNSVSGLKLVSADEVRRRIPKINPDVSGALFASEAGICDPFGITIAAAENALLNGVEILLNTCFIDFMIENQTILGVRTDRGDFNCRWVINAAGVYADEIMHKAGCQPDFKITPRRGEYCILDPQKFTFDSVLFPVPSDRGKGLLIFTTTHGNTVIGPTSEYIADKEDKSITAEGQSYLDAQMNRLMPGQIDLRWTIATFSGLRASGNAPCLSPGSTYRGDFIVSAADEVHGLINCAGIESPGLSSAPAIALRVCDILRDQGVSLKQKREWNPIRKRRPVPRKLEMDDRKELIRKDPRYGRIICRCEEITEGEIVAEIHAPIPALTYDAIKRRTWCGTGRCQGGFDITRVTEILARETGMAVESISKKGVGSEYIFGRTKQTGGCECSDAGM